MRSLWVYLPAIKLLIAIPKESFLVIQRLLVPRSPWISKSEDAQAS